MLHFVQDIGMNREEHIIGEMPIQGLLIWLKDPVYQFASFMSLCRSDVVKGFRNKGN